MRKQIVVNLVEYPIDLDMYVYSQWQEAKGSKFSELGDKLKEASETTAMILLMELAYYGVREACAESGIEFSLTEREFIKSLSLEEATNAVGIVLKAIQPEMVKENKRQQVSKPNRKA